MGDDLVSRVQCKKTVPCRKSVAATVLGMDLTNIRMRVDDERQIIKLDHDDEV